MKLIPAIDLKDNKCVRLTKGKEQSAKIYNPDPIQQAKYFEEQGCERMHIVDLDAAFGRPEVNKKTILKIRKSIKIPIQLGGGLRREEDLFFWFENNIDYLIVGSLALKNSDVVKKIAKDFKNKIYVSADVAVDGRANKLMIKGWVENSEMNSEDISIIYNNSDIRGYIITDVSRDGTMEGLNIDALFSIIKPLDKKIIFGGGLNSYDNLKKLNVAYKTLSPDATYKKNQEIEGVIIGKAFYLGNIEIKKGIDILYNKEN